MLADGAVSRRVFVAGLTPVEIGRAFPAADNYVGRMFFRTTDSMLYRFDGTSFVATLPTTQLTGQITSGQLAANAVSANAIQSGAVVAGKISVANLAAISANLGTITAGTIYGAYIATADATTRVELNGTANQFRAYRNGQQTVTISGGQTGSGQPAYVSVMDAVANGALVSAYNQSGGLGIWAQSNGIAIQGTTLGLGPAVTGLGGAGVGINGSTSLGSGVRGIASLNGIGVEGISNLYVGVKGQGSGVAGVLGIATTGDGLSGNANTTGSFGVGCRGRGVVGIVGDVTEAANPSVRADLNGVPGAGKMLAASYINFTGVHEELIHRTEAPVPGDIMVDTGTVFRRDVVNATSVVSLASVPNQRGAIGVFVERHRLGNVVPPALMSRPRRRKMARPPPAREYRPLCKVYDVAAVAAVGEGMINVCGEGGDIEVGDLIATSSIPGKGMRQADDIVRSCTVARAREAARFSRPHEVRMIACIYLAG
ncbi:MAG: hypothetical protein AB7O45_02380 [Alphaproteobacteria bacterium]